MKKILLVCLVGLFTSCQDHRISPVDKVDYATSVSGVYKIKSASYLGYDATNLYKTSLLSLQRLSADSVRATYSFEPPAITTSENWFLSPITQDTIRLVGKGNSAIYKNGTIETALADGTLRLIFIK